MSSTTVAEFANELKKSPETLLEQLRTAGVSKRSSSDNLTESDKQQLLSFLQASHGTAAVDRKKITLVKKSTSEIKQADATGKARTIQVEVRKKRTFIQREEDVRPESAAVVEQEVQPTAAETAHNADLSRREEEARRQAEQIRHQETELAAKRREREELERREREAEERAAAYAAQEEARRAQAMAEKEVASKEQAEAAAAARAAAAAAREKAESESRARAQEEATRAADLSERRRKAEAEAAAIRSMMSTPKKVLVAKKPEEPKPVAKPGEAAKPGAKGTLHKPAVGTGTGRPAAPAAAPAGGAGAGKEVKSAKLSSSWADDAAKKRAALKTRGDTGGGRAGWRVGRCCRAGTSICAGSRRRV